MINVVIMIVENSPIIVIISPVFFHVYKYQYTSVKRQRNAQKSLEINSQTTQHKHHLLEQRSLSLNVIVFRRCKCKVCKARKICIRSIEKVI